MPNHVELLNGMEFHIRITPMRDSGGAVMGLLADKETDETVFESEFPTYKDAYWVLMELDANAWLGADGSPVVD
jgi:hypothetical protein